MSIDIECLVIGAGVVGLAIARELASAGTEVLVLEAEEGIGMGTSSRNSEVIHAGLYYPRGSLKARLCVEGKKQLYTYCDARHIPYKRLGKLLVATSDSQVPYLEKIAAQGKANGVDDLQWLSAEQTRKLEPELDCVAAVLSPSTGIVDSHAYMLALQGDAENAGAQVILRTPMLNASIDTDGAFTCQFGGVEAMTLRCRKLINASGLHAPTLARNIKGLDPIHIPGEYYCKGSYFTLNRRAPFSHLIYPMPNSAGLGVHLTLDMGGQAKFGPDTEWIESENYLVNPAQVTAFDQAIRSWWPGLPEHALEPGYAGIRPKIVPASSAAGDFVIAGPGDHGIPGLVNLFGIESPGLTAALAIATVTAQALTAH
ncbi:NAD(P)/FAD-dependent oxidoreductase [Advenella mimigardefordensis]|uniref:Putative FAD-dependent oxidoreductase n=1 Tax=Advenella mimigardefordensis (strain DSM 17166 / LMG 22922 / DPN7) TaxID=1247726 RepID=W0PDE2_ADVMD|nr:NAD(P)/FAD-dependent oxidoreductase [Advenella mimigardefordensis]AHG64761.1 putative FAD-dependent oxidoreductase [Advenella mimigardefordensis DPN7]